MSNGSPDGSKSPPFGTFLKDEGFLEPPGSLDIVGAINHLKLDEQDHFYYPENSFPTTWNTQPYTNRYFNPLEETFQPAFKSEAPRGVWNPAFQPRRYRNDMNVHRKNAFAPRRKGDDAAKYTNSKLEDFVGEIYILCKDQHGCRFLQRQLDLGKEPGATVPYDIAATMIFNEIYVKIVELMTDPFGNYLIQKLFECVSVDQRLILVKNCANDLVRIALDPHGTRALQKLIECIGTPEESQIVIELLGPYVVSLSRDLNGNHVVQKCLQKLRPAENQFIFDAAAANCVEIATHRHGCCVLQRCLDHGNAEQRQMFLLEVARNATVLLLDPFGNYVVQYVLSRGDDQLIAIIVDHVKANFVGMSLHKFGLNVIEKSMRISRLTKELVGVLLKEEAHFNDLLNDAFGNYVLQTSLDVADRADFAKLSEALLPLLAGIKGTPHGRRILMKIQQ